MFFNIIGKSFGIRKSQELRQILISYYGEENVSTMTTEQKEAALRYLPKNLFYKASNIKANVAIAGMMLGVVSIGTVAAVRADLLSGDIRDWIVYGTGLTAGVALLNNRYELINALNSYLRPSRWKSWVDKVSQQTLAQLNRHESPAPGLCKALFQ
ncbi:MAG: hypothetical protein R2827_14375 [Bdellovibrionales bacterium]